MQNYTNIEKSAFRKGEYVGYGSGVWLIRKSRNRPGLWVAESRDDKRDSIYAPSLKVLSAILQHAGKAA